jgi:FKBP-type peptidyl-prolyl cis-trans isomerase (trigger factor)
MLILERLAETEDLGAGEEEIEARLAEIAERNNRTSAQVRGELRKAGRLDAIVDSLTEEKVFAWLAERSTIEDEAGPE